MRSFSSVLVTVGAIARLASAQTTVTITPSSLLQQIDGFGVSQAFGRALQFSALTDPARQLGLDYLFSTTIGAGLTIIRNRIGSGGPGDSIQPYAPTSNTASGLYIWDGVDAGQVWFTQQALTYGVKAIYADAWSAPGFMKTNGLDTGGGYLCGVTGQSCASGDWRQAYAKFLLQYVKFYAQIGIAVTHLGFLNEPELVTSYSSMISTGEQSASFIPILSAAFVAAGYGNISLTCCDAEGWASQKTMTAAIIAAGADKYLDVITSHAYTSNPTTPMLTSLKTWQTEAADLNDPFCTTWYSSGGACEGLTWANKISVGLVSANLSAYLYWEGVEPNATSSSSHLIDTDGTNVTPSGRLWAFAMFSRWIRPGAYRVTSSGAITGVTYGAFKNVDGTIAVIFTNTASTSQSIVVAFSGYTATSASAWLMDNTHTIVATTATISGGSVLLSIPAYSVVSLLLGGGTAAVSSSKSSTSSSKTTTSRSSSTIGSTTTSGGTLTTSSSSVRKTSSSSTMSTELSITQTTAPGATGIQTRWGQCAGSSYSGPTSCVTPYACSTANVWYGQCV